MSSIRGLYGRDGLEREPAGRIVGSSPLVQMEAQLPNGVAIMIAAAGPVSIQLVVEECDAVCFVQLAGASGRPPVDRGRRAPQPIPRLDVWG